MMRSIDAYIKKKRGFNEGQESRKETKRKNGIESKEIRAKHNICKLQAQDIDINW